MKKPRCVLSMIQASSELSKPSLLIWPRLMNRCDDLLYRSCPPYRRRQSLKRLREEIAIP
jgi:hypothetical protein